MKEKNVVEFKRECEKYLSKFSLGVLRTYGRTLKLRNPTMMKKEELISDIIATLCGEFVPTRTKKGAPSKEQYVSPQIVEKIESLKKQYLGGEYCSKEKKIGLQRIDISKMKAVGTIRAIDELGRVSVPCEARRLMGIKDRGMVEQMLYEDENGEIILVMRLVK